MQQGHHIKTFPIDQETKSKMSRAAVFVTAIAILFLSTGSCFPMPGDQKPSPAGTSLRAVPAGAYPLDGYGPRHNTGAGKRASQSGQAQVAAQEDPEARVSTTATGDTAVAGDRYQGKHYGY